MNNNNSPS